MRPPRTAPRGPTNRPHRPCRRPRSRRLDRRSRSCSSGAFPPARMLRGGYPVGGVGATDRGLRRATRGRGGRRPSTPSAASGIIRTRSGANAWTNSGSWLTMIIAPGHPCAPGRSPFAGGSRLFVGSSSSNRFLCPATSCASASFVFSPPESVPASWNAIEPVRPNIPSSERSCWSSAGEDAFMCENASTSVIPSCSCA